MLEDFGVFLGNCLSIMYPNVFFLAFICTALVATALIMIRSPAPFTIMVAFVTFALIAGGSILSNITGSFPIISTGFLPVLILAIVIIGGVIGLAFWRIFRY